ncbi:hypothetical protein [Pseudoalteromonas sp. S558]|uniref:hypothetical protein n=1 Tax=Pseudoalteromonas sp. S558 TaxID=2066515 RepID=UPI00110AA752|nr:hypothetical protein [Pseudoalteromonas sp. S558]TMO05492.1 hypothetical protein CWB66_06655 [Pseudoalteromonas sp. S558]
MAARAKITEEMQFKIERMIWLWKGKLTWDSLVKKILIDFDLKISRQSLKDYAGIYSSYKRKKIQPTDTYIKAARYANSNDEDTAAQIEKLKIEVQLKNKIINEQKRFLQRILHNAIDIPALKGNLDILIAERPEDKM